MGKRKERRLAALSNAGRRVKLDLFAEPSGDFGGSSVTDEVGGDTDPTQRAGLPKSPSSSGQQPQNPLLLLGQYSDDELDEESNKTLSQAFSESSLAGHGDQERLLEEVKDADGNVVEDLGDQKAINNTTAADASQSSEGIDAIEGDMTGSTDACKETYPSEMNNAAGTSDAQVVGDVSLGWKVVLHEESNQYYYWNTETGETSWDVPDVLAQATQLNLDQKTPNTLNTECVALETNEPSSVLDADSGNSSPVAAVDVSVGATLASESMQSTRQEVDVSVEGQKSDHLKDKNWVTNVDQVGLQNNLNVVNAIHGDGSEYKNYPVAPDELNEGTELSASLVKQCESLMERLKSLRGFDGQSPAHDWRSAYILEVQIRHSDIRSLSPYGSSLLPFWVHSEKQLQQLEDLINKKIYELAVSAQMEEDDDDDLETTTDAYFKEKGRSVGSSGHESEPTGYDNIHIPKYSCPNTNDENNLHEVAKRDAENPVQVSSLASPSKLVEGGPIPIQEVNGTSNTKLESYVGEDIDMDVDMDIEETTTGAITTMGDVSDTKSIAAAEQPILTNPPVDNQLLPQRDLLCVPPPPEDEWIPPPPPDNDQVPPPPPDNEQVPLPPPDNEEVPPPPPDEPLESSCPSLPSHSEMGQTFQYTNSYNLSYPDPSYEYYGNALTVPSSNLFTHPDASQVAVPDPSLYYGAVPHTYAETASIVIPVGPVAYYDLQHGSIVPIPDASNVDSSLLHAEVVPASYSTISSGPTGSIDPSAESGSNVKIATLAISGEADLVSTEAPTASASGQILGSVTDSTESGPAITNDASAVTADVPAQVTAAKAPSKAALRSKKRTLAVVPSLRSNKKVSSMVDKWKAAKEELQENEEEEPENAYQMLERKQQREIEEWKAKQIASGGAKDNPNFQPLGGDWRERVKRRRVQAAKESAHLQAEAAADGNQQPDLAKLSRGLPTGWQVYWDEASRQVYYGNTSTQETTWTRPAQ